MRTTRVVAVAVAVALGAGFPVLAIPQQDAAGVPPAAGEGDRFRSFAALAAERTEGEDFRVTVLDRKAAVTVLAIHGGVIEPGSEALARAIAGEDLNLYVFEALTRRQLHLTSARFDDPRAVSLAEAARLCVSVHGYAEASLKDICVGGANARLRKRVAKALRAKLPDLEVHSPCKRFGGSAKKNIVNRCAEGGVQLELSRALRDELAADPGLTRRIADVVRRPLGVTREH